MRIFRKTPSGPETFEPLDTEFDTGAQSAQETSEVPATIMTEEEIIARLVAGCRQLSDDEFEERFGESGSNEIRFR